MEKCAIKDTTNVLPHQNQIRHCYFRGIFALRAQRALLLDYVPPEEPPSTPLGNAFRIR